MTPAAQFRPSLDTGGTAAGFLLALLLVAALAIGAFFYFGGRADVEVKKPDVQVTAKPNPPTP